MRLTDSTQSKLQYVRRLLRIVYHDTFHLFLYLQAISKKSLVRSLTFSVLGVFSTIRNITTFIRHKIHIRLVGTNGIFRRVLAGILYQIRLLRRMNNYEYRKTSDFNYSCFFRMGGVLSLWVGFFPILPLVCLFLVVFLGDDHFKTSLWAGFYISAFHDTIHPLWCVGRKFQHLEIPCFADPAPLWRGSFTKIHFLSYLKVNINYN